MYKANNNFFNVNLQKKCLHNLLAMLFIIPHINNCVDLLITVKRYGCFPQRSLTLELCEFKISTPSILALNNLY